MTTEDLIAEALTRPIEERVAIADTLLQSLNPVDPDIESQWVAVAKERLAEMRAGAVEAVPSEEVFKRIRQRFAK